jgi:DNA adenine methylase
MICNFCGLEHDPNEAEIDSFQQGFWCGDCDGYTYLSKAGGQHRFTLLLEDKQACNVAIPSVDIPFNKRLSPLRYPGGKSKIIPYIYSKLQVNASKRLVGAFAGGASLELALLHAGVIDELVLNDLDFGIYAMFWTIQHAPEELIFQIRSNTPTHEDYFKAQAVLKSDYQGCTLFEAAWSMLLVNRLAYSGIYKANPLGGRQGDQESLLSRWNPINLCKRIELIHKMSDWITIMNKDACELIEEEYWKKHTTIFIDPPYVAKGQQLYRCYYDKDEHVRLNVLLDSLHQGMPGADIILTYDNDPLIEDIYLYPTIEKISRIYSI